MSDGRGGRTRIGIAIAAGVVVIAAAGLLLLRTKSVDNRSRELIPAVLDRVEVALPQGSTVIDKSTSVTANNYKTIGRLIFVSGDGAPATRARVLGAMGWFECQDEVVRSHRCDAAPGPSDVLAKVQSAVKTSARSDAGKLLGEREGEFQDGAVVFQIVVGTE